MAFIINYKNIELKNDSISKNNNGSINYKYDINKQVKDLDLKITDDYVDYLNELKLKIKPLALQKLINIDKRIARVYKDADMTQKQTGNDIVYELISGGYDSLFNIVIQKNQTWTDLPLTKHFRSKFNEKDGCIKECNFTGKSTHSHSFKNKTFSIEYTYVPDDAYEKYPKEVIDYMLEYNGAYNMDYYNYKFVLDEEGYLDDIVFIGITPRMVEGRFVDEGE